MKTDRTLSNNRLLIHRHGALVRLTHWINAITILVLILSGLQILCAHPAFYWGETSRFAHPLAEVASAPDATGQLRGQLRVGHLKFDTTGFLGASRGADGTLQARTFPAWLTLPGELDLGAGRRWHFFFAWLLVLNGAVYLARGLPRWKILQDMVPTGDQLAHIPHDIVEHVRLRFPSGDAARRYSVLQKLAYLPVVFVFVPVMVLTGLSMSPEIDARLHFLPMMFGGRQSARTVHFISVCGIVGFIVLHLVMVVVAGPINLLRSMITGRMVIKKGGDPA